MRKQGKRFVRRIDPLAAFRSAMDRYSALECVAEIERELAKKVGADETADDAQEIAQAQLDAMVLRDA